MLVAGALSEPVLEPEPLPLPDSVLEPEPELELEPVSVELEPEPVVVVVIMVEALEPVASVPVAVAYWNMISKGCPT